MASPMVRVRLDQRLHARMLEAAQREGLSVSGFVRRAILDRLGDATREAAERAALLQAAHKFIAANPGTEETSIVERLAGFLEEVDGRISRAEQRGRLRALQEVSRGALAPLASGDGEVIELADYRLRDERDLPVVLETPPPRRRGFLRLSLLEQNARELLAAAPASEPLPRAGLLGPKVATELFTEAIRWPGVRRVFCEVHGVVPCAPSSDGSRCCYGCEIPTSDGPEAA